LIGIGANMSSNSQNVNFNNVKARDIKVKQSLHANVGISQPTSKEEFTSVINKLIGELENIANNNQDIEDAITELKLAHQETRKKKPETSAIKRFLTAAKGSLVDVSQSVAAVGTIVTTITMLIGTLKPLFGG
jgi:hypothetical protein